MRSSGEDDGISAFREVAAAFGRAIAHNAPDVSEIHVRFAGRAARVRIVGTELAAHVRRAFSHLETRPDTPELTPELTIDLWDESTAGVSAPVLETRDVGPSWPVGGGLLTSGCQGRIIAHQLEQSQMWLDRQAQRLIGSVRSAADLSMYQRGKPLHYVLSLWHNDRATYVIHAGLVAKAGRGVLIAGAGGAGKSTTALACVCDGFQYLADDCVALECTANGVFLGHSIYSAPWLEHRHLERFPGIAPYTTRGALADEDKAIVLLSEVHPDRLERVTTIDAIVLPRIVSTASSSVHPASKGAALLALAPSSIVLFAPSPGADGMRQVARLVAGVRTFWLNAGADLESIPRAVESVIDRDGA